MKPEGPSFTRKLFWHLAHTSNKVSCQRCGKRGVELPAATKDALCAECRRGRLQRELAKNLSKSHKSR